MPRFMLGSNSRSRRPFPVPAPSDIVANRFTCGSTMRCCFFRAAAEARLFIKRLCCGVFLCGLVLAPCRSALAVAWNRIATVTTMINGQVCITDGTNIICDSTTPTISAGNVGIGSTSPRSILDLSQNTGAMILPIGTTGQEPATSINGMIRYNTTLTDVEAYIGNYWTTLTIGGDTASIYLGTSATATDPSRSGDATTGLFSAATSTVSIATGGVQRMTVNSSGYVGIGTTAPAVALDVNGQIQTKGSVAGIIFQDRGSANPWQWYSNSGYAYLFNGSVSPLAVYGAGSVANTLVLNAGNVGIGSTSPRAILDLSQNTGAMILPIGTTGQEPATSINGMIRYNTTLTDIEAYIGGFWTTLTTGGGSASIYLGTSATATDPSVAGDPTSGLFSAATSTVSVATGGHAMLTIGTQTINVPIGTSAGTYQGGLQLQGNLALWQDNNNQNIIVGSSAFPTTVTSGNENLAIGDLALNSLTTAATNVAIGYAALEYDQNVSGDVAIGYAALQHNNVGGAGNNVAIGAAALIADTTGDRNIAIGADALESNQNGGSHVAIGANALITTNGANADVAIGLNALESTTTGSNNIAIGYQTGASYPTGGNYNILIGSGVSTPLNADASDTLNIGNAIYGTGLYGSTPKIGIASTAPRASLDLSSNTDALILPIGTTGQRPTTGINGMIRYNSSGTPGVEAYINNAWAAFSTATATTINLGTSAGANNPQVSGDATTGLFSAATSTVSVATGGAEVLRATASQQVGIGTASPATGMKVDINGPVKVAGTGSEACSMLTLGAMRYNATGNYMEICTYP